MEAQKPAVASTPDSPNSSNFKRPRKWLFIPVLIVIGVTLYFFHDISQRNSHVNNENYRLLYEASVEFNNNLNKLRRAHQNGESGTAIRGLFASYKNSKEEKDAFNNAIYQLKARKLVVQSTHDQAVGDELASLSDSDILPQSASVFSKVLIVNEQDKVLTTLGNETKISFSDLSFITKAFIKSQQSIFATTSNKTGTSTGKPQKLPTHSSHVDVKLAHGDYRVYVFPFTLEQELAYPAPGIPKGYNKTARLTLVGFVENIELSKRATSKWNIPLIVISVLTLCVLVAVLRLYLQPKNQFTTRFFRGFVVVTCYLAFSASLALVLASVESQYLTHIKKRATEHYITALADQFNTEIYQIFNAAHRYRPFYQTLSKLSRQAGFQGDSLKNYCFDIQTPKAVNDRHTIPLLVNLAQEGAYCRSTAANNLTVSYATVDSEESVKPATRRLVNNHTSFTELNTNKSGQAFKHVVNNINTTLPSREAGQGSVGILAQSLALIESTGKSVAGVKLADHEAALVLPDGLISLLALNRYGNPALPSFYYRENFSTPRTINLSHRQYFKKVRDQQGWHLPLRKDITDASRTMRNVYIQRLRNVTNGTTGTTLSMPLFEHINEPMGEGSDWNEGSLVLIADVLIPAMEYFQLAAINATVNAAVSNDNKVMSHSVNSVHGSIKKAGTALQFEHLAQLKPSAIYADLTHMVLDRNTGHVLFHSQADRALNENIFYSGNNQQGLTEWIKSSGYQTMQNRNPVQVSGNYHGKAGTFFLQPTVIDDWALVVFAPSELSTWFQNNKFIYYMIVITLLMAVSFALVKGLSLAVNSHGKSHGRTNDVISYELQRRLGFIATNIIILVVTISAVVKLLPIGSVIWYLPLTLVILAIIMYLMWLVWLRLPLHLFKDIRRLGRAIKRVPVNIWLTVSAVFVLVFWYLSATSELSLSGVALQQQNYQCALINAKREEVTKQALTLFPNSITNYQQQPAALMLGNSRYLENAACDNKSVTPNDFPNFATAVGNQQLWRWLHAYMLPKSSTERVQLDAEKPVLAMLGYTALMIILVTVLSAIWYLLHSKVLWTFLYFGMDFLRHIEKLGQDLANIPTDKRDARLLIKGDNIRLNGVELNLYTSLLKRDKLENPIVQSLIALSPALTAVVEDGVKLSNLKMSVTGDTDEAQKVLNLSVHLWDLETCLEQRALRQHLLAIIIDIKGLVLDNKISNFCLYSGFHCLQRVALKDALAQAESDDIRLEHIEYLSWSECLMDFNFQLPESFERDVDHALVVREVAHFPELKSIDALAGLASQATGESGERQPQPLERDVSPLLATQKKWATINFILIHAEAFYRFKWELCSNAEKLALFNLAKKRYLNPSNSQMVEHLALNGLIRVDSDDIRLVNDSFAYFVLNAEPPEVMGKLFKLSEQGVWKNYRVPIVLSIALLLGAVALISGESLFIIFGSIAGVLTTIASMTNSANLIRNQFN
ncbi:hypothetical protein DXX93_06730 [Thalassotalea euphylliae]|uniref:Uncharacterized protein n=1 Tax=Thalassotalea euphylliae TaxID=1655234 RepID=A0A3E0TPN4_9GAMM|nr:hypothetical protein [Thalassotalea euphylliae]REL26307.1 hypothetical protein DXX93_06730 [Thalassotalea euphylliae]